MKLTPADREKIVDFYRRAARRHLFDRSKAVGWSSRQGQLLRFAVLEKVGPLDGASILDVGCGLGDFYGFLSRCRQDISYTGIDIMPQFIVRARRHFPGAVFEHRELDEVFASYDFVLASGSLNTKIPGHREFVFSAIEKMFGLARVAAGFNLLDIRRHVDDGHYAPYHPEEILSFCRRLTPKLALIQGYLPWDFTVFLYR